MPRTSDRNWTTQSGWLAIAAVVLAPFAWSQHENMHPAAELQRNERWVAGAPYPLTQFEQRLREAQLEPFPSERLREPVTPGLVSVKELRHPISKRDAKFLETAQKELQGDRRESALRKLEASLAQPHLADYARAILGLDALRRGDTDAAVKSLRESARGMPNNASIRGHLGVALAASGWTSLAEDELRHALALQPDLTIAQYVLGVVLLNQPHRYQEAAECLRAAGAQIPQARLALAVLYALSGEQKRMRETVKAAGSAAGSNHAAQSEQWVLAASMLAQPSAAFGVRPRTEDQVTPPEGAPRD